MGIDKKICIGCDKVLELSQFTKYTHSGNGKVYYRSRCKACASSYSNAWMKINNYKNPNEKKNKFKSRYGMFTQEDYNILFDRQNGLCALCDEPVNEKLHVDHDHSCCDGPTRRICGKCVRGLLCGKCNRELGFIEKWISLGWVKPEGRLVDYLNRRYTP